MRWLATLLVLLAPAGSFALPFAHREPKKSTEELRAEYLASVQQAIVGGPAVHTTGSLWSPQGVLIDPNADYKARTLNDTVTSTLR